MAFDFTTPIDKTRAGHDALAFDALGAGGDMAPAKPDEGFDEIPMWVADMNFPTLPTITDAIIARAQEPHFGYFAPSDAYYRSIIDWQQKRNGVEGLLPKHISYENGVLGGVVSALASFMEPGDAVLLHSPTYIGFTHCLEDNGFKIVLSPLKRDNQGIWRMDYADMEQKLKDGHIHAAVFCSPHNPAGRVWEREEIEQAMALYAKYDCVVVSDEIWSDIIMPGHKHIPTQSVSDDARKRTVALYAPSKTFSLAGLIGSYSIIYNDYLRDRVRARASKSHYNSMNVLSMHALIGAYKPEGHQWVAELNQVLSTNIDWAYNHICEHYQGVELAKPEGTYMLFLDCTTWCKEHSMTIDELLAAGWRVGVGWQDGRPFHGHCHIRMNLALPTARVQEAFERLDKYVFN